MVVVKLELNFFGSRLKEEKVEKVFDREKKGWSDGEREKYVLSKGKCECFLGASRREQCERMEVVISPGEKKTPWTIISPNNNCPDLRLSLLFWYKILYQLHQRVDSLYKYPLLLLLI